jgi:hypothetical protein
LPACQGDNRLRREIVEELPKDYVSAQKKVKRSDCGIGFDHCLNPPGEEDRLLEAASEPRVGGDKSEFFPGVGHQPERSIDQRDQKLNPGFGRHWEIIPGERPNGPEEFLPEAIEVSARAN